jgi:hypothetical protein
VLSQQTEKDNSRIDFIEFWENFHVLPWKISDEIFNKPRYLNISIAFVYAIVAIVTYFPSNRWIYPIFHQGLYSETGFPRLLLLKVYPTLHILLVAWIIVSSLIIRWRHKIPGFFKWLWDSNTLQSQDKDLKFEY